MNDSKGAQGRKSCGQLMNDSSQHRHGKTLVIFVLHVIPQALNQDLKAKADVIIMKEKSFHLTIFHVCIFHVILQLLLPSVPSPYSVVNPHLLVLSEGTPFIYVEFVFVVRKTIHVMRCLVNCQFEGQFVLILVLFRLKGRCTLTILYLT